MCEKKQTDNDPTGPPKTNVNIKTGKEMKENFILFWFCGGWNQNGWGGGRCMNQLNSFKGENGLMISSAHTFVHACVMCN